MWLSVWIEVQMVCNKEVHRTCCSCFSVRPISVSHECSPVVKVRGLGGGSAPLLRLCPPLLESEPSLPTAVEFHQKSQCAL